MENIDWTNLLSWLSGFVLAWITIYLTIRHFKTSKTISYIERLNSVDMVEIRASIDEWLSLEKSDEEKSKIANKDKELAAQLMIWMNIFTELGISYKYRIIRRKLTREIFYPMIPSYWDKLNFYIQDRRGNGSAIGFYFEYISKEIRKIEGKNQSSLKKRYPYLINKKRNEN